MYLPIWLDLQILKLLVLWFYGRFIEQSCNIIMLIYAQMANFSYVAYFVSIDTATSIRIKAIDNRTILLAESHHVVGSCTPLLFSLPAPPSRILGTELSILGVSWPRMLRRAYRKFDRRHYSGQKTPARCSTKHRTKNGLCGIKWPYSEISFVFHFFWSGH